MMRTSYAGIVRVDDADDARAEDLSKGYVTEKKS
jgi:hypothetical protein